GGNTDFDEVTGLELDKKIKKIVTPSGEYFCKTLVLSTGANPKELGIANESKFIGKGIHYCAHCDGRFYKDKTVAVIGGGNSAASDAMYLSNLAKKVYLVHRRDTLRATKLYHAPLNKAKNVEFLWNSTVNSLTYEERINGFTVKNTKTCEEKHIDCDGIFISIGRKPATDFLKGELSLDESGYIIADETTKTHIPGVFAIGDVRTKPLRQVVTAAADGATCVHFAEEYLAEISD
ncbi:MAG: thioredoxin-disulfide reductase, partial [Ruminococcaceae bacterium]|nr:thioredoxin-disulfide reductase [Oscillospiraceae bacterium]